MALLYIALILCLIGILIGILSIIGIIVLYKSI
nr:MAG TPA: MacB-like periplasmic core domain [Caudoviricetes sp.]